MGGVKSAMSAEDLARSELVVNLSQLDAEVVISALANEDLAGSVTEGYCVTDVNGSSIRELGDSEAMATIDQALKERPVTLTFLSPDGLVPLEHTFSAAGPLKLRFSHRIKYLNDEMHAMEEVMLTTPKNKRKELKNKVQVMEEAVAHSAEIYTTKQNRRGTNPGLAMPGDQTAEPSACLDDMSAEEVSALVSKLQTQAARSIILE